MLAWLWEPRQPACNASRHSLKMILHQLAGGQLQLEACWSTEGPVCNHQLRGAVTTQILVAGCAVELNA